jgi:hypothetical protein
LKRADRYGQLKKQTEAKACVMHILCKLMHIRFSPSSSLVAKA